MSGIPITNHRYVEQPPQQELPKEPSRPVIEAPPPGLTTYAYRWDTVEPNPTQLKKADSFFLKTPPKHLWSEAKFKKIDYGDAPEV